MKVTDESIGKALERLRDSQELTRADLARKSGVAPGTINRTEDGLQSINVNSLLTLLETLNTTPGAFFNSIEGDRHLNGIKIVPGFEESYRQLTTIFESADKEALSAFTVMLARMSRLVAIEQEAKDPTKPVSKPRRRTKAEQGDTASLEKRRKGYRDVVGKPPRAS